jgi:hypothetical protein
MELKENVKETLEHGWDQGSHQRRNLRAEATRGAGKSPRSYLGWTILRVKPYRPNQKNRQYQLIITIDYV